MSDNNAIYLATFEAMLKELGQLTTERSELWKEREALDVRIKLLQTAVEALRPFSTADQPIEKEKSDG